jgi:DNA polymerase epsilon subunit 2
MGVISQLEDGHFFLEDLSASIPVDLSQAIS